MTLHTQRLTAAAALQPPKPGMALTKIRLFGGATPGAFGIRYNGIARAWFPCPSDGTRGFAEYDVTWGIAGTNVPAGSVSFEGGLAAVELVYSDQGGGGPDIASFRAIRFARTDVGAATAIIETEYDEAPGVPRQIVAMISASRGRAVFPGLGVTAFQIEAAPTSFIPPVQDVPEGLPLANALTLDVAADGAATSQYIVYH